MRNTIDAVADRDFVLDYLYACAGLFVRSFHNVRSLDLGFQPEHVIVAAS